MSIDRGGAVRSRPSLLSKAIARLGARLEAWSRRGPAAAAPVLESLESRQLLSALVLDADPGAVLNSYTTGGNGTYVLTLPGSSITTGSGKTYVNDMTTTWSKA